MWPNILSPALWHGRERLLAAGWLLPAPLAGGHRLLGDAARQIPLQSGQMLSGRGFAPSAPGRDQQENWEPVLEEYGQKLARPGEEAAIWQASCWLRN